MNTFFRKLKIIVTIDKMPFYGVARGRNTGVFLTWPECQMQVMGFRAPLFRKFQSFGEAEHFVTINGGTMPSNDFPNYYSSDSENNSDDEHDSPSTSDKNNGDVKEIIYSGKTKNPQDRIKALKKYIQELSERNEKLTTDIAATTSGSIKKRSADSSLVFGDESTPTKNKKPNADDTSPSKGQMKKYGKYWFVEDADGYVQVYTDGSCENNGRPNAIAGLGVFFNDGHALNTSEPVSGRATNNCGEIQASTLAIKLAAENNVPKLCINTDSKFLINSITQWIKGWKARGWRLKDGKPVKNEIDFKLLDNMINSTKIDIKWNYVKAHCGILGNERADALAREGGQMYKRLHQMSE